MKGGSGVDSRRGRRETHFGNAGAKLVPVAFGPGRVAPGGLGTRAQGSATWRKDNEKDKEKENEVGEGGYDSPRRS